MSDEKKIDMTAEAKAELEAAETVTKGPDGLSPEEEAELEAAEQSAAEFAETEFGGYIHKFRKPFAYMGKTYRELAFDFEKLTGKDMLSIGQELQMLRINFSNPTLNLEFQARVVVRACAEKIGVDAVKAMPAFDFHCITGMARNFLMSADLHAQNELLTAVISRAGSRSKP